MKPYFQDKFTTIYHGDCREILPGLPNVPLICSDPPYGIGEAAGKNKSRKNSAVPTDYGDETWDDAPPDKSTIDLLISKADHCILFGGNFFRVPPSSCWLVWDKDNSGDFADCELAWTNLKKAVRMKTHRWNGMLQQNMAKKEHRFHPTQKPVPVMTWAILQAPDTCHTVLDPFCGSGTTLIAAKDLNRLSIGVDQSEKYCEIAARRLSQEVLTFS